MAQFRLTRKFAQDCRIQSLQAPKSTAVPFDDWVVDRMTISRKKVAVITHVKTLYTTLIPYAVAGGAKNIAKHFFRLLQQFMQESDFALDLEFVRTLEKSPVIFCKTDNRHVLGHMNDFKRCIEAQVYYQSYDEVNFDELAKQTNEMPINVHLIGYTDANTLMRNLLANSN